MKKCKYCKSDIDKKAKVCPKCGKRQGVSGCLIAIIIILIILIAGALIGSNGSSDNETKTSTTTEEKFTLVEVTSAAADDYNIAYYIEGMIKNNKDKDYDYVQVEFTTYDADGNTLGTCLDNSSGLEANGTWKFKAMCTDNVEEIASYKLKEITGW